MLNKVKLMGAAAAVLATVSMAMPADAQWRGKYRHRDRVDGGDMLLGAVIAGGLIALISGAEKSRRERERYDTPPPPSRDRLPPREQAPEPDYDGPVEVSDEDSAVDACAMAAEDEGRGMARIAQVTEVTAVDAVRNGWTVRGTVELSDGYRGQRRGYGFSCSVATHGAARVRIAGG